MRVASIELRKLSAQLKVRAAVAVCACAPLLLALVLGVQDGLPRDTLFGRSVRDSGLALPLLVLGVAGSWVLPLLTSVVAGDVFATEDAQGTWQALLTRSRTRTEVFVGKVVASACVAVGLLALTATSSVLAGLALGGRHPLTDLSGRSVAFAAGLPLVAASWLSVVPALLGFTALACLLSVLSRSSVVGVGGPVVLGLLMQLLSLVGGAGRATDLLLTTPFSAWHGLVRADPYYGPLWQGVLVSAVWSVACLLPAHRALVSRDFS